MSALIWVIVLIAVVAIVCWFLQQVPLPKPLQIAAYAIIAIIAIILIAKVLVGVVGMPPGL